MEALSAAEGPDQLGMQVLRNIAQSPGLEPQGAAPLPHRVAATETVRLPQPHQSTRTPEVLPAQPYDPLDDVPRSIRRKMMEESRAQSPRGTETQHLQQVAGPADSPGSTACGRPGH